MKPSIGPRFPSVGFSGGLYDKRNTDDSFREIDPSSLAACDLPCNIATRGMLQIS
jgi:hypothetical protein